MDVLDKLTILTDAAKYDAACTSSGGNRGSKVGYVGNTSSSVAGCCHSFSADGRCVTLLKVLLTNRCIYDCKYCVNRRSNDTRRAAFTPEELADLTIQFYRRNYIEGLFLSSGVFRSPDYTTELMIRALRLLREQYRFNGYIHAKTIPGTAPELVEQLGLLADRLSVNIELPSEAGLQTLAPEKTKGAILAPMRQIQVRSRQNREELVKYRHAPKFAPAGQSTQLIVGATFYGFRAEELLDEQNQDFDPRVDPKCSWALAHLDFFPVEVNTADYETLLRIPGIGVVSARRILAARRVGPLHTEHLKKLGVVMKRAQYFLTASGQMTEGLRFTPDSLLRSLIAAERPLLPQQEMVQLSLFDSA